jgi:6-pyruvoyltetrahydropterin/6-carboxytetrahydropterin synthase
MFTLYVKDTFSAAHRIEDYNGKCEALHGHNFQVEVLFTGERLGKGGMLVDFKILKNYLRKILKTLDHSYINEIPFFMERSGSSEYLSMYIFNEFKKLLKEKEITLKEVRVWESEKTYAAYCE